VAFSIGIAVLRHGDSLASMVKRADAALYRAKSSGRNRVMVEQPERRTEGAALRG